MASKRDFVVAGMSIENEDLSLVEQSEEITEHSSKLSKISYTREFLLSLSELEACKKLPKGFESLPSDIEEWVLVRPSSKIATLQSFRRNDYSSSPPGRGEGTYSRGLQRWDSRSSGRSDTDSQSDKDSDSGRRFGSQFRRWQNPEHDGLLGRGSFPRPTGYGGGAAKLRSSEQHQLSRSNDAYQPPRPYKAVPQAKREDSVNDETFGSSEVNSEDRVEEERKRRAEFEMMRKVQHKALQEKQKSSADKPQQDPLFEMITDISENNRTVTNKTVIGFEEPMVKPVTQSDSGKLCSSSHTTPLRPLVPPGFSNTTVEKNPASKSLSHSDPVEVVKLEHGADIQDKKEVALPLTSKVGPKSSLYEMLNPVSEAETQPPQALNMLALEGHGKNSTLGIGSKLTSGLAIKHDGDGSVSILDKIFSGALTLNGGDNESIVQDNDIQKDDVWSPRTLQSSKFAQWFPEEENNPKSEDLLPGRSSDLLSLIVGEKGGSLVPGTKVDEERNLFETDQGKVASNSMLKAAEGYGTSSGESNSKAKTAILTCEDLEQSILSEIGEPSSVSQLSVEGCNSHDVEKNSHMDVNNGASNHLLSLLLKGGSCSSSPLSQMGQNFSNVPSDLVGEVQGNINDVNTDNSNSSARKLTLESLFGTAFMNELHSADQPVSIQRSSSGSARIDAVESAELSRTMSCDENILSANGVVHPHRDKLERNLLAFGNSHRREVDSFELSNELESKFGSLDESIRLPKEDCLISVSGSLNTHSSSVHLPGHVNVELLPSSSRSSMTIAEKLAALNASVKDDRSLARRQDGNTTYLHSPYDMMKQEVSFSNVHPQSAPQFNPPPHMNNGRPMFHPMDSQSVHMDPQLKFMSPEGMMLHHEGPRPSHHRFPGNMPGPQPLNPGLHEFERPVHPLLHQQMRIPSNVPPHILHGLPGRGGAIHPHHPSVSPASFIQEQGFLYNQRQPNLGGHGMSHPGTELGGLNNQSPEAYQRLLERELWSNQKQARPPFSAGGSGHTAMHGHELDSGFWYR